MLKYNPEDRIRNILTGRILSTLTASRQPDKSDFPYLFELVFLGRSRFFGSKTPSGKLNYSQQQALACLGIKPHKFAYYYQGLVNAATLHEPLDIVSIYQYFRTQIALIAIHPDSHLAKDVQALQRGLELCFTAQVSLAEESSTLIKTLQQEQKLQLAQLGCIFLPPTLISKLREPVHFVDTTCVALGKLAQTILLTGEAQCVPSQQLIFTTQKTTQPQTSCGTA